MDKPKIYYEPADIAVYIQGRRVLQEKSLAAWNKREEKFAAFGAEAEQIAQRSPEDIELISPLRQGFIADYMTAINLFSHFMLKALGKKPFRKPAVAVCIPKGITEVEKKAIEDALIQAGSRELFIADIPVEEFVIWFPQKFPKLASKFKITIGITKEEPEKYVIEKFVQVLEYARQEGISCEKAVKLLERAKEQAEML